MGDDGVLNLERTTIGKLQKQYAVSGLTARAVTEAYLKRIKKLNEDLNALCAISEDALSQAEELDRYRDEHDGALKGPLHGIPMVIKDQIETAGMVTAFGSKTAEKYVPERDATVVQKLKHAGAVIIGKSMMPDWAASWFSTSSLSGTAKNPFDYTRDPGGSSSGTGAAVAGSLAVAGIGGDTGGSIRLPSSFCNLVGVRCTPGRISRDGMSSLVATQDTPGPMTNNVEDAALILDAIVGFDPRDEYTYINNLVPPPSFLSAISNYSLTGKSFGVIRSAFGTHPGVLSVMDNTLSRLVAAGATLIDISIPDLDRLKIFTSVYYTRSKSDINAFLSARSSPDLPSSFDAVHASGIYHSALDLIDVIASGPSDPFTEPEFAARLQVQSQFQRLVGSLFAAHSLSGILYPTCQLPAPKTKDVLEGKWTCLDYPTNTIIASQLCFPAVSVPVGWCRDEEITGHVEWKGIQLPVGLEILGLPLGEEGLLAAAKGIEDVMKAMRVPDV
ncbi:hypothetical protein M8818_007693 [Zalaria obscura]|uniref:Uncharacterized protein n=1 Tax=Zalaria obscura TaxID=2024903 RepID=A0ACC3S2M8_9PEZI